MESPPTNDAGLSPDEAREIYHSQKQPVLVVNKDFVYLTGSTDAALFLSKCIYWDNIMWKRKKCGTFYKTDKEWREETALTIDEIKYVRKKLVALNYISVTREKAGGITHYAVNLSKIVEGQDKFHAKPDSTKSINKAVKKALSDRENSTSLGENSTSLGENSTSLGENSTSLGENSTSLGENSTSDIIHKITHKITNQTTEPSTETNDAEATQGMDGFNKIIEGIKYKQAPSDLRQLRDVLAIDSETRAFMAIWPTLDKTSYKLVKQALEIALTKKSFKFLCEYADDFVRAQKHNNRSHEFITRPHTWLNKEMWPVKKTQGSVVERIYRKATEEINPSKAMERKIREMLETDLGKETYRIIFPPEKVSIILQRDSSSVLFMFDTPQQKKEAENYYTQVKNTIENIEGLQGSNILFTETPNPVRKYQRKNTQLCHNDIKAKSFPSIPYQTIREEIFERRKERAEKELSPLLSPVLSMSGEGG
jgi:hypothetical protein